LQQRFRADRPRLISIDLVEISAFFEAQFFSCEKLPFCGSLLQVSFCCKNAAGRRCSGALRLFNVSSPNFLFLGT
jgi:hypothetical protein